MSRTRTPQHVLALAVITLLLAGCSPKEHDTIVAKIADQPVTLKEYEDLYSKSNSSREASAKSTQEERERFLDLVVKFKLKLMDAYNQGLNKKPELRAEIDQYKSSLASSFLTDREINTPGAKILYDRRRNEYRASHILLALNTATTAKDSAAVYSKADSIIAKLKAGAKFNELAVQYSQDPSAAQNKGDLYYFTAGQMVPPFEDAVFKMKVGEISQKPVLSQFGLHIIKLTDVRPARGEINASHIMIRFDKQDPSPEDTLVAYQKAKAIQDSLKAGIAFAELAIRNSGDPGSASKGGDLGWFSRRRWIQSFDEVVQTLKPGEISGIVRTIYGYHLIRCNDEHPPKSYADAAKEVQQLYQQTRYQDDYKAYLSNLKKKTQYVLHEDVLRKFIAACDTNKTTKDSAWWSTIPKSVASAGLITFGSRSVSVDSVITLISTRPDFVNTPLRDPGGIRNMVDKVAEPLIFAERAETLEKDSPEFAAIMKEYTDGILLYQIEQDRVWNSVTVTDSILKIYFNNNRDRFTYPDRVDFTELRAADDSVAHLLYKQARSGKKLEEIAAADSARMAMKSNFQVEFKAGSSAMTPLMTKTLAPVVDELKKDAGLRVQLMTHPDTSAKRTQNPKVANQRVEAIRAYFKKQGISESRVLILSQPYSKVTISDKNEKTALNLRVTTDIVGRRAMITGKPETAMLPTTTDERTQKADSLQEGQVSSPFRSKYGVSLVRLNKREPSRQKSFEEAGTEVSSSFQEYESKRLESEWIGGLRKKYPVVEYKEALKGAFAPQQ